MASRMTDEELRRETLELEARLARAQAQQAHQGGSFPYVPRGTRRGRGPRGRGRGRFQPFSLHNTQSPPTFRNRQAHFGTPRGGSGIATPLSRPVSTPVGKTDELCPNFTSTGSCALSGRCSYIHDPDKTAVCKTFLQKGHCANGTSCDLSHELNPHRVPVCTYFSSGICTNEKCRYPHIKQNPAAPVCSQFAKLGYCDKGAECTHLHRFECPDYANNGTCTNRGCKLPHIDRASNLRRRKEASANGVNGSTLHLDEMTKDDSNPRIDPDTQEALVINLSDDPDLDTAAEEEEYIRL